MGTSNIRNIQLRGVNLSTLYARHAFSSLKQWITSVEIPTGNSLKNVLVEQKIPGQLGTTNLKSKKIAFYSITLLMFSMVDYQSMSKEKSKKYLKHDTPYYLS